MASVYRKDGRWYLRYRDATGRWRGQVSRARTRKQARRLADELERRAEAVRLGVAAPETDCSRTLGELCSWWLEERCSPASLERERSRLQRHVLDHPIAAVPLVALTPAQLEDHLRALERPGKRRSSRAPDAPLGRAAGGLGANSLNHLRAVLSGVFTQGIRAGKWTGKNVARDVATRAVPRRVFPTLAADEVPLVLAAVAPRWRNLFATAIYTGLRAGELFGLKASDVDLGRRLLTVARSGDRGTTKGGHADVIPLAEPLLPFLTDALDQAPTGWVFRGPAGQVRPGQLRALPRLLRQALARAGLADAYDHVCRRCKAKGRRPNSWRHRDRNERRCPTCAMRLWPKPEVRPIRFHDLRHTAATLMLRAGVDPFRVQRILRHRDIRLTTATYGHLVVEDLRSALATLPAIPSEIVSELVTPVLRTPAARPSAAQMPEKCRAISRKRSGAPSMIRTCGLRIRSSDGSDGEGAPPSPATQNDSDSRTELAPAEARLGRKSIPFVTPVLPARALSGRLLTVRQVAERLGVCRQFVYDRLIATRELPHVRVRNAIRVEPADLEALIAAGRV